MEEVILDCSNNDILDRIQSLNSKVTCLNILVVMCSVIIILLIRSSYKC